MAAERRSGRALRHLREADLLPLGFRSVLGRDLDRALGPVRRRKRLNALLADSEVNCVACYRFGRLAHACKVRHPFVGALAVTAYRLWNRRVTHRHHCEISHRAQIGPGLRIMHRHGVMIGPAVIGADCQIHHNVTIGERVAAGDHGVPHLGNGVWIGPGATIVGDITVGDGATISAGTVLSKDVPPRSLVAGNPGRVIAQDYDNSGFLPRSASVGGAARQSA